MRDFRKQTERDLIQVLLVMQLIALTSPEAPATNLGVLVGWLLSRWNFRRLAEAAGNVTDQQSAQAKISAMRSVLGRLAVVAAGTVLAIGSGWCSHWGVFAGLFSLQIGILVRAFFEGLARRSSKYRLEA